MSLARAPTLGLMVDFLTENEAAAQLGKDATTLQRWRAEGLGPTPTLIGKAIYYSRDSARVWLLTQAREPVREPPRPLKKR